MEYSGEDLGLLAHRHRNHFECHACVYTRDYSRLCGWHTGTCCSDRFSFARPFMATVDNPEVFRVKV